MDDFFGQKALELSARLTETIKAEIRSAGGEIPFSRYMELALYHPDDGYYMNDLPKIGEEGDFMTAPMMSVSFCRAVANAVSALMPGDGDVLEIGPGDGSLARGVMDKLVSRAMHPSRYMLWDISPSMERTQKEQLGEDGPFEWVKSVEGPFTGVILCNELLDSFPAEIIRVRNNAFVQLCVRLGETGGFDWSERPADEALSEKLSLYAPDAEELGEGYTFEFVPGITWLLARIAQATQDTQAVCILIDYGFPESDFFAPARSAGTLMCHTRHKAHGNPFYRPGLTDITTHVNFSYVAREAQNCGLDVLCMTNMTRFLFESRILNEATAMMNELSPGDYDREMGYVRRLLLENEMGELFKVMVLGRNVEPPDVLVDIDKSGRL